MAQETTRKVFRLGECAGAMDPPSGKDAASNGRLVAPPSDLFMCPGHQGPDQEHVSMAEEVFLCGTEPRKKEKLELRRLVLDTAGRFIDGTCEAGGRRHG